MKYSSRQYAQALAELISENEWSEYPKIVKNFVSTLSQHNSLNRIKNIVLDFEQVYEKNNMGQQISLTTASKDSAQTIRANFSQTLRVNETIDPNTRGGVKIKIDDERIDASIGHRLLDLKRALGI